MNVTHNPRGSVVEYADGMRLVAGRLRYSTAPEPGTIVGPKDITREHLVVLTTTDDGWTLLGYASDDDLAQAMRIALRFGPRSANERIGYQGVARALRLRLRGVFDGVRP